MPAPTWDNTVPTWDETQPKTVKASAVPTWDETAPVTEEPSAYDKATEIRKTEKGEALKSYPITDEELQIVAQQTGTDFKRLKELTPYFGVMTEGEPLSDVPKAIAGQAGRMAFNIPQKLLKVSQDDKYEKALDIVDNLARQKQSYLLDIAGIMGGPAGAATKIISTTKAAKAAETAAEAAPIISKGIKQATALGALSGAASAEQGEELKLGAIGAAAGGTLSATLPIVGRTIKSVGRWSDKKLQDGLNNIRANGANIEEAYSKARPERLLELDAIKEASKLNIRDPKKFNISDELANKLVSTEAKTAAMQPGSKENELLLEFLSNKAKTGRDSADMVMSESAVTKALAYLKLKSVSKSLRRTYGESLSQLQKSRKSEDLDNMLEQMDKAEFALQAVTGKGFEKNFNPLERIGYKLMAYLSDSKPYLQVLDDRYGTNFEVIADSASKKLNLVYGAGVRRWAKDVNEIANMTKDPAKYKQIVQEIESGSISSPEAQKISSFFNAVRNDANENGANIAMLEGGGYFPKIRKSPAEYIHAYRKEAARLQKDMDIDFSDLTDESIKKLMKGNSEFNQFVNETLRVTDLGKPTALNIKQGYQLLNNDISKTRQALNIKAFATQQRADTELPIWAREIDPARAASRWVSNTYKFLALKDEIAELSVAEQIARKAKDDIATEYLSNLRKDWMGGRTDTLASWGSKQAEKWQIKMQTAAEKAQKSGQNNMAKIYEGAKELPSLFIRGQNNIYTNALGLSPKAAIQNIASFYTQNFPELGNATSVYYAARALPKLGKLIRQGEMGNFVFNKGLIDRDWSGEAQNVLSGQFRKSLARQMSGKAAEKYSNTVMAAFKGSELIARAMTTLIAEDVAQNVLNNTALRNKLVLNMKSGAYRRLFQHALEKRDEEGIKKVLTSYLNSNNMFNYNKINQAEFARSLGPMFAIFSKWPTMAIGTQMKDLLSGGGMTPAVIRNMRMLYLPYMTMYLADKVSNETLKPLVGNERYEATIGKKGLHGLMITDATPTGVFERGGILASPAIRAASTVAKSIVSDEAYGKRFSEAFKQLTMTYVPVIPLAERLITRDLPRLIDNEPIKKSK